MSLIVDVLQYGTGSHTTSSETANALATDLVSDGVIGALTNTSGVSPSTGAFALNSSGAADGSLAITAGVAYVTGTPTSQGSQRLRVKLTATTPLALTANATGSTRYDWVYIKLDPTNMANPNTAADNVATLVSSRSTSNTVDNGTPPTYGYCLGYVTTANGFTATTTISNGSITDSRVQTGATAKAMTSTNGTIAAKDLATSAIKLGYAQITSNFTTTSGVAVQVTGLTVTVTIPAGGRSIKITAFAPSIENNTANMYAEMTIWDGTVGSGTQISAASTRGTVASQPTPAIAMAIVTPAAGSKTYNVGFAVPGAAGTGQLTAAPTIKPAFILVEAI